MFSVVIPLYNKQESVKKTVESVLNQTFQDFEIVIVNDGSTDNSVSVVQGIQDLRIRIIDKPNGGVSSARNRGIEESIFEWIAFLDADDLWKPEHLETLQGMITTHSEDKVFCTSFIKNDEEIDILANSVIIIDDYFLATLNANFFWTSVVAIHKDVFQKVGVFKEHLSRGEDLELWARIGRVYRIVKSSLVTGIYVQDSENKLTNIKTNIDKSIVGHIDFRQVRTRNEGRYYQRMVKRKLITSLGLGDIVTVFQLIYKYHLNIIKRY